MFIETTELNRLIAEYFVECKEEKDVPTIAGLADKLGILSNDIRNVKPDSSCYTEFRKAINKISIIAEKGMLLKYPDKWQNINEGLVAVEKQEVNQAPQTHRVIFGGDDE